MNLLSIKKENFVPESFHDIAYSDSDIADMMKIDK